MSAPVDVNGGSGGITANRDAIEHLAALYRSVAGELWTTEFALRHEADTLGEWTFVGAYGDARGLDVAGVFPAVSALDDAVTGLHRAQTEADELGTKLRWAAQGYPWRTEPLGTALGPVRGLLNSLGPIAGLAGTVGRTPPPTAPVAGRDPGSLDTLLALAGVGPLSELVSGDGDGSGAAVALGVASVAAPRTLADLVTGLGTVNRSGGPGGIDVRILTGSDGRRHVVVDITGTRTWRPGGHNPADLTTNTRGLVGHDTAYSQGVLMALRQAGVRSDEPVMLVGHSQGGVVAVNTAAVAARTHEFHISHVVTAGSPIGMVVGRLPASVRVLALENSRDIVPRLDTAPNPDRRSVVTVSGAYGDGSVSDSHDIDSSYTPLAGAAERHGGRSVRDFLTGAAGFFRGERAEQHAFRVERR